MTSRLTDDAVDAATPTTTVAAALPDLTLRTPPNWTAVCFFAALGGLHLGNAVTSLINDRQAGFLSLGFAAVFLAVAVAAWLVACELTVLRRERRIRLRSGYRRLALERSISFRNVHGVRMTHSTGRAPLACKVEVLCDNEDLVCPPTAYPNQQALYLALAMNVRLIKVYPDDPTVSPRRDESVN